MAAQIFDPLQRGLRVRQVAIQLDCSQPTVWRLARDVASFPKPFKLSGRITLWDAAEVERYLASRRDYRPTGLAAAKAKIAQVGPTAVGEPVKVWPGRPRKRTIEQIVAAAVAHALAAAGAAPAGPLPGPEELPVKRGPGRPRKNPLTVVHSKPEATA